MKRTNRDKDWGFLSALGVRMVEAGDERGWSHIFRPDILQELLGTANCPDSAAAARPALQMARDRDPRTVGALNAERQLWEELDRRRIHILQERLKPYVSAVRRAKAAVGELRLPEDHELRLKCAEEHLPQKPLRDYGLDRYITESKRSLVETGVIPEAALAWLPDVRLYFQWL